MLIHDFIKTKASDVYFQEQHARNPRLKREYFAENDVMLEGWDVRIAYKEWFKSHKNVFEKTKIIEYWVQANEKKLQSIHCPVF